MKKLLAVVLLACLSACTSSTGYGPCIGAFDDRDAALVYEMDVGNVVLGVVFVEAIIPPVLVLANETFCPVGKKSGEAFAEVK